MTFANSTFAGNEAGREGGALWNQGETTMTVTACNIENNASFGEMITNGGAGIFNNGGNLIVLSSSIASNVDMGADAAGAGVHNKAEGTIDVSTSTISSNTSANGGGVYTNGSEFTINASTVAFNTATIRGGGLQSMTGVEIKNTIVSNNTAPEGVDIAGDGFVSLGYNLIAMDDAGVFTSATGDILGSDPLLNPTLEFVTGGTSTHSLQSKSPAYNAGDPEDNFNDQNNQSVFDGRRDIGAHESQNVLNSTSNPEFTESVIEAFPNPTFDQANIDIPAEFGENIIISIHSMSTGRIIQKVAVQPGKVAIDLNTYPSGIYLFMVRSDKYSNNLLVSKIN